MPPGPLVSLAANCTDAPPVAPAPRTLQTGLFRRRPRSARPVRGHIATLCGAITPTSVRWPRSPLRSCVRCETNISRALCRISAAWFSRERTPTRPIVLRARRGKRSSAGGARYSARRSLRRKSVRDRRAPHSILRRLSLARGERCLRRDALPARHATTGTDNGRHQLLRDLARLVAQELKGGWALMGR